MEVLEKGGEGWGAGVEREGRRKGGGGAERKGGREGGVECWR